ncbi:MAG: purine-binding chemotaxis protein CheW [Deltaproteobacteria bacterium]|nr:purine-binding chemotaxis protein CheW [Deltaproteobacteria bacterium]
MNTQSQRLSLVVSQTPTTDLLPEEHEQQLLRTRARLLARPRAKQTEATNATVKLVQFLIGDETYAFDAIFLREVYRMKEYTRIPGARPHVLGVINVRGLMVAVIDLHRLLGFSSKVTTARDQVLILQAQGKEVGILTDGTLGIRALSIEKIYPVPPMVAETRAVYLRGVTDEQMIVLNTEKILFDVRGVT